MALTFSTNSSYTVFLQTLFFNTSLSSLKPAAEDCNTSISNLSVSNSKLAISNFLAKFYISTPVVFFKSDFAA